MKVLLALAATLSMACATPRLANESLAVPVSVSSHNKRDMDVYLLCGGRNAQWLGVVRGKDSAAFELPLSLAHCARGLEFFLVPRDYERGYWVGPIRVRQGQSVRLTIERYAPLSIARVYY